MCIVTFNGIGNILGVLPILTAIELAAPKAKIFLPQPLSDYARSAYCICAQQLQLNFYPASWYRFTPKNWPEILEFIRANDISVVLNWRNDGYLYKASFNIFREHIEKTTSVTIYDVADLDSVSLANMSIWEQIHATTERWISVRPTKLTRLFSQTHCRIHVFPCASKRVKRLSVEFWKSTLERITGALSVNFGVSLHEPVDDPDMWNAICSLEVCHAAQIRLIAPQRSITALRETLNDAICCLSLDSYPMHLAAYLSIPNLACFVATDPRVWAHSAATEVIGSPKLNCPKWRLFSGNCNEYYRTCLDDCLPNENELARDVSNATIDLVARQQAPTLSSMTVFLSTQDV